MTSRYEDKYEKVMLEEDFKFCRLIEGYSLYKKWNGEVVIAKVTSQGKLEILLHVTINETSDLGGKK